MRNPILRFKLNKESFPDWKIVRLGDVTYIKTRIGWQRLTKSEYLTSGDYYLVTGTDISRNNRVDYKKCLYVTKERYDKDSNIQLQNNDIIITKDGTIGKVALIENLDKPATLNSHLFLLRDKSGLLDNKYFFYSFFTPRFKKFIERQKTGSTLTGLPQKTLVEFEIPYPSLEEQQKIADFFSTLDQKIELNERKREVLEKIKKSLMQKIFSQEIRFKSKNGNNFGDWKKLKIDDVATIQGGGTPSTQIAEYWNGEIQWMTPTEINSKYVHNSLRTITKLGLANSSAKLLPKGSILLTTRATIGACSINNFDGDVCTNQGFQSLICKNNIISEFLYYSINRPAFQKEMKKIASGSTFLEVSPSNLKKITLQIPSIEEQKRISDFFSIFDKKINLIKLKINALKQIKQGLMQQMFV